MWSPRTKKVRNIDMKKHKRKKLTKKIIDDILNGKLVIWIWITIDDRDNPMQLVFPGRPSFHKAYPYRNSYFTCPNSPDNFYVKEFDYFWFVTFAKENEEVKVQ